MKKALIIFAIAVASIAITFVISQQHQYFPSKILLTYHSANAENMTMYFDVGEGFQQRARGVAALEQSTLAESLSLNMSLPRKQVNAIRLDLDSKDNLQQAIVMEQLCITRNSIVGHNEHCWSAKQLFESFVPMNAIDSYQLVDNSSENSVGLFVQAKGSDPYFSLNISFSEMQKKVLGIQLSHFVLLAIAIAMVMYVALKALLLWIFPFVVDSFKRQWQQSFSIPFGAAVAGISLLSVFLSGSWLIAYKAGAVASSLLVGGIVLVALMPSQCSFETRGFFSSRWALLQQMFQQKNLLPLVCISVITLLPIMWLFTSTWVQEFPHLGDHEYHAWGNRVSYHVISHNQSALLLALIMMIVAYFFGWLRWAVIAVAVLLISTSVWNVLPASFLSDAQGIFARYPGGSRILTLPLVHWSYQFEWADPLNTGRLLNVLSVPIWLLVLRPLIIGRLPRWETLMVCGLFFWQAEIVYQFSSAYLDIWSVVFILLATEKLILSQTDPAFLDDNGYLKACLLLSVACAFKEPAVFIIPWFWFAGWSYGVFKIQSKKALFVRFYHACVVGFASVLPFLVYYVVRKFYGISRYTTKGFEYFLGGEWFAEMVTRISFHFGWFGSALLVMILLLWLFVFFAPIWRAQRWMMACIFVAFLSQIFLFNWDQGGIAFTGYFRFYLPSLVLFSAPLLLIAASQQQIGKLFSKITLLLTTIIFVGNAPALLASAYKLSEPDSARNFNEHYDAPIYLPIRSLIKTAETAGVLEEEKRNIYINHVTGWNQPAFVYPNLLKKYKLQMDKDTHCGCSESTPTVLAPFVNITGLNERVKGLSIDEVKQIPQHQARYVKRWREVNDSMGMCLAEIERSCQYSAKETLNDGTVIGVIGVGVKDK